MARARIPTPRAKDGLGRYGEQLAADHLTAAGWQLLDRNWRCPEGELDLVAIDRSGTAPVLVFCEVKTRTSAAFGSPAEAVGRVKVARLRRVAGARLAAHSHPYAGVRFDVVAVLRPHTGPASLEHLRGVC